MSRVLLLGGTGVIGRYLPPFLEQDGHQVFVTSRQPRDHVGTVRFVHGNAQDLGFLRDCVRQIRPDAIVDFMIYGTEAFRDRVEWLLGASAHYLFFSSFAVHAYFDRARSVPLREDSPRLLEACVGRDEAFLRTDAYPLAKARQEDALRAAGERHPDQVWTIIRPSIAFDRTRFQLADYPRGTLLWRAATNRPIALPERMAQCRTTMTFGQDVARLVAKLVLNPKAYGEVFLAATGESLTWREIGEVFHQTLGTSFATCSEEDYIRCCGDERWIRYSQMNDRVVDNCKILAATGLAQSGFVPLRECLARELSAARGAGCPQGGALAQGARVDALLGLPMPGGLSLRERMDYQMARHPKLARSLSVRGIRWLLRQVGGR